ncbi:MULTISPECIES: lipid A biosynthesis lauroyl acyltransferase [unclassified Haematospirillum]|uniref:lipid A biosynthesis lauroyl acyltransferase n=1 Tax=unclassified Haematospirillum TaxID=2622088 RepID=UPI00143BDDAC|nr:MULTISPECIES: lipid A biosynthesis lauroyl acyltransferase [unclassified Haematospirillum]NKD54614.1 lipid A biosynthesis lauroyl acyltransferase [Haematospirillum sp. H4890]NKD74774.1 lipid A biosynthesis lauroyl acyltransferase [Haematospirillum sp. H4485]NKD87985.1 lipid A biosynthesis lauroyl acyltransferase [Haematospirillum sp. 15-248]
MREKPTVTDILLVTLACLYWGLMRVLPIDAASRFGGLVLRIIGPRLRAHRIASRNLRQAFPEQDEAWIQRTLKGMWDNLGRNVGEFPHLERIMDRANGRIQLNGAEHIQALAEDGIGGIFFSAHLANWELAALSAADQGLPIHLFYRAPNNPLMRRLFTRLRRGNGILLPKGASGAKQGLALLKSGEHVGMLVDQKMNDGIPVPFFGRTAMTAPALAQFVLKYAIPAVPARVIRLNGARFRIDILPPLSPETCADHHDGVEKIMKDVNAMVEGWIRENPEQWLWVHRRWPDE